VVFESLALANSVSLRQNQETHFMGLFKLGSIGARSLNYISDQYENKEARNVQLLEGRIQLVPELVDSQLGLGMDLEGQVSVAQPMLNSFTANELYFRIDPLWTEATLYLGRKRSKFSNLDARWKLGVWEPIFKVDALDPHSQGLTGLFVAFESAEMTYEFFASPFFLPDHGPQVETRDGEFVKGHPWVQYPPEELTMAGQPIATHYNIDRPDLGDVVIQQSYGLSIRKGDSSQTGMSVGLAWAHKPMNQLLLGLDPDMSLVGQSRWDIGIHPEVGTHEVGSLDLSYRAEHWLTYVGGLSDSPSEKIFDGPWTYQKFSAATIVGGGMEFFADGWQIGLGYLQRRGGDSRMVGKAAPYLSDSLPERFLFEELLNAELAYEGDLAVHWAYEVKGGWRQELRARSEIVALQGSLMMGPYWKGFLGVDLLKAGDGVADRKDFVESYRNNDRAYGGIQYVF
jgi:hypothetical protein